MTTGRDCLTRIWVISAETLPMICLELVQSRNCSLHLSKGKSALNSLAYWLPHCTALAPFPAGAACCLPLKCQKPLYVGLASKNLQPDFANYWVFFHPSWCSCVFPIASLGVFLLCCYSYGFASADIVIAAMTHAYMDMRILPAFLPSPRLW